MVLLPKLQVELRNLRLVISWPSVSRSYGKLSSKWDTFIDTSIFVYIDTSFFTKLIGWFEFLSHTIELVFLILI